MAIATALPRQPDLIVISPFLRTRQTAEPTMRRFPDVAVETWPVQEFTYLSPGRCTGMTAAQRRPLVEAYWQRCDPEHVDGLGAESFSAMLRRVRWLRERLATHAADYIVVFTHGQVMQACRLLEAHAGTITWLIRHPGRPGPHLDDPLVVRKAHVVPSKPHKYEIIFR